MPVPPVGEPETYLNEFQDGSVVLQEGGSAVSHGGTYLDMKQDGYQRRTVPSAEPEARQGSNGFQSTQ